MGGLGKWIGTVASGWDRDPVPSSKERAETLRLVRCEGHTQPAQLECSFPSPVNPLPSPSGDTAVCHKLRVVWHNQWLLRPYSRGSEHQGGVSPNPGTREAALAGLTGIHRESRSFWGVPSPTPDFREQAEANGDLFILQRIRSTSCVTV